MTSIKKQINKVTALSASLDELERRLEPLLSKPLPDTLSSLDTLQQAKLQTLLSYLINDLIFIYLKTRGIDPKTHPVVVELDRVKQYFGKIKDAEESNKKRTTELDKAAAGRFIKHAISEAHRSIAATEPSTTEAGPSNPQCVKSVPTRVTEKMKEREEYLRRLGEESESDEPVLDVIDGVAEEANAKAAIKKGKGVAHDQSTTVPEATISVEATSESPKKKKRKLPMDPFGSYGEEAPPAADSNEKPKNRKNKKIAAVVDNETPTESRSSHSSKKDGELKKKRKRMANRGSTEDGTS